MNVFPILDVCHVACCNVYLMILSRRFIVSTMFQPWDYHHKQVGNKTCEKRPISFVAGLIYYSLTIPYKIV